MKNGIIIAALLLATGAAALANPIGMAEARQKAQTFMNQKGKTVKATAARTPRKNGGSQQAALYVFNAEAEAGFVVVAGDDRVEPILGYADQGQYDEENVPQNMKAWLQGYADYIELLDQTQASTPVQGAVSPIPSPIPVGSGQHAAPQRVATHAAISPLLSSKWNQGDNNSPTYNQYCPQQGGKYCYTGCVATAMAQIMYYHQWPQEQTAAVGSLAPVQFDWDGMKPVYSASDAQSDYAAVARLMQYCGYAVDMNYGTDGSSAYSYDVAPALTDCFDYAPTTRYAIRSYYSIASWDELIYSELAEQRPVYYSGVSTGGGHAFVCDGYDGKGFYHINWGWGGMCNGFFKLSVLNPDDSGIGGSSTSDGYTMGQEAVVGIQPSKDFTELPVQRLTVSEWEVTGNEIQATVYNLSGYDGTYNMGYGMASSPGDEPELLFMYEGDYFMQNMYSGYLLSCNIEDLQLTDGTYLIGPACKLATEDEWHFCEGRQPYLLVQKSGSDIDIQYGAGHMLSATSLTPVGNCIVNTPQRIDVEVNNDYLEYEGGLYLFASKTASKGSYQGAAGFAIEAGGQEMVSLYFTPETTGKYNLWVATDEDGQDIIGTGTIDVIAAPTGDVTLQLADCQIDPQPTATVSATITNTGSVAYYREVVALLYNENNLDSYQEYRSSGNLSLKAGEQKTLTFAFEGLEPGTNYTVLITYYKKYTDEYVTFLEQTEWFTVEEPALSDITEEKNRLQQLYNTLSVGIDNLQPQIDALMAQCQNLREQIQAANQRVMELQQRAAHLSELAAGADIPEETRQQLLSELEDIADAMDEAWAQAGSCENQLTIMEEELDIVSNANGSLCKKMESLGHSLAEAQTPDDLSTVEESINAYQMTYSTLLESIAESLQKIDELTADHEHLLPTIAVSSERLDYYETVLNREIARQEVANALEELPPLAPHMTYDAGEFEQIRSIVAEWKERKESMDAVCQMLLGRLQDANDAPTLSPEERETLAQELDGLLGEMTSHNNIWDEWLAAVDEYIRCSDYYEGIYQDLLGWVDAQRQAVGKASTLDEIEAIRLLVEEKYEEISEMVLPTLAAPTVEMMETETTDARLQVINLRLHEIEELLNRVPTAIMAMEQSLEEPVDVWTTNGQLVRRAATSLRDLPAGTYVVCPSEGGSQGRKMRKVYMR